MIGSKQQTHFLHFPHVSISPMSGLLRRVQKELAYLCFPEDTTDNIGHLQTEMTCLKAIETRHAFKGIFWVIVAIVVSVAVGQLL